MILWQLKPSMKNRTAVLGVALWCLGLGLVLVGCLDQGGNGSTYKGPLLRYHFAGRSHLPPATNALVYRVVDALPATAELRADLARKLSSGSMALWRRDLPAGATNVAGLLAPLFEDLQETESLVEVRGPLGRTETVVACELGEDRAQLWDNRLRTVVGAWQFGAPRENNFEGFRGWEARRAQSPNTVQFFRAGRWVLVGLGQDGVPQLSAMLKQIKGGGRPVKGLTGPFLEWSADLPALRPWFPALARYPLPALVTSVAGRGDSIRTEMRMHYSTAIPWQPEPWRIPTNVIYEPITSFTAGQGIAPLYKAFTRGYDLGMGSVPNQFCAWGARHPQCRTFFSVPTATDSSNLILTVGQNLPKFLLDTVTNAQGDFYFVSNRSEVVWAGLQWMVPVLHPDRNGKDNFLVGGNFPLAAKGQLAPEELFSQLRGRPSLMYYDWEITQERIVHARQLYQLFCLATGRFAPADDSPMQKWMAEVGPHLTNTVTEITRVGPQELSLVRKSHIGLTGFELASLAIWLDSPGFPFDISLPSLIPAKVRATNAKRRGLTITNQPVARPVGAAATNRPAPPKR